MGRRLNTYVHVHGAGESQAYGPDDIVPDEVAALITAPGVWADEDEQPEAAADPAVVGDEADETELEATAPTAPPKAGKGSSKDAWHSYAKANGVEVDEDASRDDVIAACEAAGVPVE